MPGVSYEQLMKPIQIYKLVKLLYQQGAFFQNLMRMRASDAPSIITYNRTFGYDIYASTRTMAPVTAPQSPPAYMGLKPVGQNTATLVRTHGAIRIFDEKVFMSRPVGGRLSEVDAAGRKYVALQLEHLIQTFRNNREFMISRMLRGGFGLQETDGDQFRLCELKDADARLQINYGVPAENKADLGGIIAAGEGWDQPGAPILEHFMAIGKRMTQKTGYSPRHCIVNSNTIAPLFLNTTLRSIQGQNYTIYNTFTKKPISPQDAQSSAVYTVVFGGCPMIQFHVLNEGLVLDEVVPNLANQTSDANFKLFLPDGKAIIIPEPDGRWAGYAAGVEPVREKVSQDVPRNITGFGVWRTPEIDPSRYDVKALDNGVPLLYMPGVVHFADVWSPFTSSEA